MKTFVTSDLHLCHKKIIKLSKRTQFLVEGETLDNYTNASLDNMHEKMIENWNAKVPQDGIVFVVGDFAMGSVSKAISIAERMNGFKILIRGNHDSEKIWNKSIWVAVHDYYELEVPGEQCKIPLFHFPMEFWNKSHYGAKHIHGHCHGALPITSQRADAGMDVHNYAPISIEDMLNKMAAAPKHERVDHHYGE